jgi:chromosome segregation ATPase
MKHLSFLILTLLLVSPTAFAQTVPTDSDTLKALLAEVRLLRHDLQTTIVAAQRAQILIYRVQGQESVVRPLQERVDDTRSKLAQIHSEQKMLTVEMKQNEELLDHNEHATTRKEVEETIARIKTRLETQANAEQESQAKLVESEQQLRMEQAKLDGLQSQLDRLEKTLENFNGQR